MFICIQAWSKGMTLSKTTAVRNKLTSWNNVVSVCQNTRGPRQRLLQPPSVAITSETRRTLSFLSPSHKYGCLLRDVCCCCLENEISLLLFNVLNFLTAASIPYTLPHLHLLCYKLGRDCEKLRQWRQIEIKWKMFCLVHRENSIFNVKPRVTATTAELHQYFKGRVQECSFRCHTWNKLKGVGALVRVMTQRWMWKVTSTWADRSVLPRRRKRGGDATRCATSQCAGWQKEEDNPNVRQTFDLRMNRTQFLTA